MTAGQRPLAAALFLLAGLPVAGTAVLALGALFDAAAWRALWHDPAWLRALGLSLWTGLASTALAWGISAALLAQGFVQQSLGRWLRALPVMLATPHAAFAIGLVFLLSPSGWVLRALSPWLTGFDWPPAWRTTQDPWGLGLVAALVAKEVPFLLWTAATQLQRDDLRTRWRQEHALAQTLGYGAQRAWWRVIWPQLARRLRWPLLAVLAYGLTVVDMALIIGPASPPTLGVLAWQWLQDADLATNAQGAAAAGLLALAVLACALCGQGLQRLSPLRARLTDGVRGRCAQGASFDPVDPVTTPAHLERTSLRPEPVEGFTGSWQAGLRQAQPERGVSRRVGSDLSSTLGWWLLGLLYGAVLLALAVGSVAGVWPFPLLWPEVLTAQAWHSVWDSRGTVGTTLALATASSALALAWSVAWLELAPRRWDATLRPLLYLSLVLPAVLWVVGLYGLALWLRIEGRWPALLLAHTQMALPYVLLSLAPAYTGFDPRYRAISDSLGHGRGHFLLRIKWPLLRRALAASAAVGFAVSVAQYLPTLYLGAGRWATVTTEAVNLAAGAQRSLTSAYAGLQFVLPVLAFGLAAWIGRPRRFTVAAT
jgi:putative thiamine transport system permease protein